MTVISLEEGPAALAAAKREKIAVAAVSFILMVGFKTWERLESENGIAECVRRRRKTGG